MKKAKKIKLKSLKVQSFVTVPEEETKDLKAGGTWSICKTCGDECLTRDTVLCCQ